MSKKEANLIITVLFYLHFLVFEFSPETIMQKFSILFLALTIASYINDTSLIPKFDNNFENIIIFVS